MASLGKLGVAVIGLGRIGSTHVKTLRVSTRASIRYLVDDDLDKATKMAAGFDSQPKCLHPSQLDTLMGDKSVDGVFVCTPTNLHQQHVTAALHAGKAVFCEKPLTDNTDSTRTCYHLAERSGLPLMCAFHRRFDPSFNKVRDSIHSSASGRLRMLRFSSHDPSPPTLDYVKSSGGILSDSTVHDIDLALWMSGSPAKSVYVQGQAFNSGIEKCGDHDLVVVIVTHENGAVSVIDNGRRCAFGYDQRLEAMCDDATFQVANRPTHQMSDLRADHNNSPATDQSFNSRYTDAYAIEVNHFLDVMQGAPLKVTRDDTLATMTLVQEARKSLREGTKILLS